MPHRRKVIVFGLAAVAMIAVALIVAWNEFIEDEIITPLPASLGSHGYLSSVAQMNGVFVAWGRGIKPGTELGVVDNIDVAPTMAAVLGENLSGAEGKALRNMLADSMRH